MLVSVCVIFCKLLGIIMCVIIEEHFPSEEGSSQSLYMDLPVFDNNRQEDKKRNDEIGGGGFNKKLICLISAAAGDDDDSGISVTLQQHPSLLFLPDFPDSMTRYLFECESAYLAYIVDAVNTGILRERNLHNSTSPSSPWQPWCGSHRTTKKYIAQQQSTGVKQCRPISKSRVKKLCEERHLVTRLDPHNAQHQVKMLQTNIPSDRIKIIKVTINEDNIGHGRSLQQIQQQRTTSEQQTLYNNDGDDNNDDDDNDDNDNDEFYIRQDYAFSDLLALFNYLDIHIPSDMLDTLQHRKTL